jgi:serine/threonine protein kinase
MDATNHKKIGSIIINRYRVTEHLGSGAMADVYRAYDAARGCDVALKVLNEECQKSPQLHERFLNEFAILSKLKHPGIVSAFDLHEDEAEAPFFSMQLLAGATLSARRAKTVHALSLDQSITALQLIANALEYIHSNKVVYCDLKPDNVMISSANEVVTITLFDFGISWQCPQQETREGSQANLLGTSFYMCPEAIRGEAPHPLWDIYSFGALAFELLTGQVPFSQKELFSITASHLLAKVPDISHYNQDLPQSFNRFIRVCLAKDPHERYQSMSEVCDRLEKLRHESSTSSILRRLLHFWHAHRHNSSIVTAPARAQKQTSAQHSDDRPQSAEENG